MSDKAVPRAPRLRPRTWQECLARRDCERDRALLMAYRQCGITMTAMAQHVGLSVTHVSRLIAVRERAEKTGQT